MKNIFLILITAFTFTTLNINAQNKQDSILVDSILIKLDNIDTKLNIIETYFNTVDAKNRYKLYSTENIYTLLELDTATGKVKQVQWSLDSNNEATFNIINENLNSTYEYSINDTYELYPTGNMYQFILLNKYNGKKCHVQWGTKGESSRWYRRIY